MTSFVSEHHNEHLSLSVHSPEYPIILTLVGIGQRSRLNARCLPIYVLVLVKHGL